MHKILWLYFSLKGRLNRKGYWLLYALPASAIAFAFGWTASDFDNSETVEWSFIALIFWPSIAVQVKRWHDINMSGWWVLANFVPVVGSIGAFIANGFISGTPEENRFGAVPQNVGT